MNLYVYGYPQNLIGVHDAIPYKVSGGTAFNPDFAIKLFQGEVQIDAQGNGYGRNVQIQNLAPFNYVGAGTFMFYDFA